jgi:REP element-mobilizing transposase RayT
MKKYFGGSHLHRKRKSKRPLEFDKLTHLILRLKDNQPAFFSPRDQILKRLFYRIAEKYGIQIEELIFNHTHIHAPIAIKDRKSYQGFIRELTSKIVTYLSKRIGIKLKEIFLHRPFTRTVNWGRGLMTLWGYMKKNEKESGILQCHVGRGLSLVCRLKSGTEYWRKVVQLSLF